MLSNVFSANDQGMVGLSRGQSAQVQEEGVRGLRHLSPAQGIIHLQISLLSMHRTWGSADLEVWVWEKECPP